MIPILQYPKNDIVTQAQVTLRFKSNPINYDEGIDQRLIDDMTEYQGKCLGLAAVQLGVPVRLIMVKSGSLYIFLVNPQVVKASKGVGLREEGCLSFYHGKERYTFKRPKRVKVRYTNLFGIQRTIKAEGLFARILQHEIDHLDGKLIIDYEKKEGKE